MPNYVNNVINPSECNSMNMKPFFPAQKFVNEYTNCANKL